MMLAAEQSGETLKDLHSTEVKSVKENKVQSQLALTKSSLTISSNSSGAADDQCTKRLSQYVANSKRCQLNSSEEHDFNTVLRLAKEAIDAGVLPQLIPNGSSGSYFVRDINGRAIAVFKPKDEEPFASLNPKWPKYFQRILCFCCFGRACLIPNHGYLSETGASLIDQKLGFNIVPKTRIVKLCSATFYHGNCCGRPMEPKAKQGSFQLFMEGYRNASDVLSEWNDIGVTSVLTPAEIDEFTIHFQKLCILDYVIRNTDRHMDNWLIRHLPGIEIKIAAIDNGLAFPIKHPECASRFRQFPFDWSALSWASKPWNDELRNYLLKLLTPLFVDELCRELTMLFRLDKTHNRLLTHFQIRVLRGQLWNLHESLLAKESPSNLVKRPPVVVSKRHRGRPRSDEWSKCFRVKPEDLNGRVCC